MINLLKVLEEYKVLNIKNKEGEWECGSVGETEGEKEGIYK